MLLNTISTWIRQHKYKAFSVLITLLIGGWLLFATILVAISSKLIFKPADSHSVKVEVPYEQLWLTDAKERQIDTLWIENPNAEQVIIYLHGNVGRLSQFFAPLSQKYSILAPAYPGYHGSTGKPTPEDVYSTALLAYDYLTQRGFKEEQIILFGHSLGGSSAVYVAAQRPQLGKLVIVNTFNSMYDMCWFKWKFACVFAKDIFNTAKYAPLVNGKVRQYHDRNDAVVPFSQGEKLYQHFTGTEDKKFTVLENATHSDYDVLAVVSGE